MVVQEIKDKYGSYSVIITAASLITGVVVTVLVIHGVVVKMNAQK